MEMGWMETHTNGPPFPYGQQPKSTENPRKDHTRWKPSENFNDGGQSISSVLTEGIYPSEGLDGGQVRFNAEMRMGWTQSRATGPGSVVSSLLLIP